MPLSRPILFDLGGVLIDWNPRYLYRKVYGEAETDFFLANVCTAPWNLAMDAGRPFAEAIREKQAEWPQYSEAISWGVMAEMPLVVIDVQRGGPRCRKARPARGAVVSLMKN